MGSSESGKSTIAKQLKILHPDIYSDAERLSYKPVVHAKTAQSIVRILETMKAFDIPFGQAGCEKHAVRLRAASAQMDDTDLASDVGRSLKVLWRDTGVQECYWKFREYCPNDSAAYYMEALERLCDAEYVPTEQDIIRATTDSIERTFEYKSLKFTLINLAGSEPQKFIHCFDDVTAIMFCVDLCTYDQVAITDRKTNRMLKSLKLFRSICNTPIFMDTSVILLLNKTDLFKEKIDRSPLTVCFPEYQGESNHEKASNYIRQQFENQNKRKFSKKIYTHFSCANDASNVRFIFDAVSNVLVSKNEDQSFEIPRDESFDFAQGTRLATLTSQRPELKPLLLLRNTHTSYKSREVF